MGELSAAAKDLILIFSVPGLYCLMLLLGRWLKRTHGVRLNWSYHLFSLCLAIYFPAKLFDERLGFRLWGTEITFRRELGALMCLLGAVFIVALVDRAQRQLVVRFEMVLGDVKVLLKLLPLFVSQLPLLRILLGVVGLCQRLLDQRPTVLLRNVFDSCDLFLHPDLDVVFMAVMAMLVVLVMLLRMTGLTRA